MKSYSENRRFLILIGMIGFVGITLSVAAYFLGPHLWSSESKTSLASVPYIDDKPDLPRTVPSFQVSRSERSASPPVPSPIVKGQVPLEFKALEEKLIAMEQALSDHAREKQALEKKMAEADTLILQAEAITQRPDISPMGPKGVDQGKENTDIDRLRERLTALKSHIGKPPVNE
uniref:Uncharacterized protein n=1 Tax=Candidatus Kentrum sp. MB TaxID=2138164 RepID=A0A450XKE7_9GAMM|nr:MAG: hypothetical protein BECKMB1821G_GA0114241_101119 [Candidatus Kentron sp. MB]VFK29805.1 MAG: hypothetical protein BECKMB1821I_GA0114274_10129 [Candidatus Kentron sp. MB]VFK74951.1 MAG: hypothetical protein BECKMB1821H_GA0114242_10139 [Candidatus Kentron sp. MB]